MLLHHPDPFTEHLARPMDLVRDAADPRRDGDPPGADRPVDTVALFRTVVELDAVRPRRPHGSRSTVAASWW